MEKVKLSLLTDAIILYGETPKEFTWELLGLINQFRYAAGHKINIQK